MADKPKDRAQPDLQRKALALDQLVAWLELLEANGVSGRFIAPREIREVIGVPRPPYREAG